MERWRLAGLSGAAHLGRWCGLSGRRSRVALPGPRSTRTNRPPGRLPPALRIPVPNQHGPQPIREQPRLVERLTAHVHLPRAWSHEPAMRIRYVPRLEACIEVRLPPEARLDEHLGRDVR